MLAKLIASYKEIKIERTELVSWPIISVNLFFDYDLYHQLVW